MPAHPEAKAVDLASTPVAGGTNRYAVVPLHLPNEAKIRAMTCFLLRDDDEAREVDVKIRRIDIQSTAPVQTLAAMDEMVGENLERVHAGGLSIEIDNFRHGYYLQYAGPSQAPLRGCRSTYVL